MLEKALDAIFAQIWGIFVLLDSVSEEEQSCVMQV